MHKDLLQFASMGILKVELTDTNTQIAQAEIDLIYKITYCVVSEQELRGYQERIKVLRQYALDITNEMVDRHIREMGL